MLGVEAEEAERQLADVAFINPETNAWFPADEYLSGNVRTKLACAKAAAAADHDRYRRNVPPAQVESQPTTQEVPPAQPEQATATRQERSEMLEHAIALADQGFHVFPLQPGTKRPVFKAWESVATTDREQIARWWTAMPSANIAIACGPSNLLVIDLDKAKKPGGPQHGQQTLTAVAAGRELPPTLTVASARGGRHLYFRQPDGATLRNTAGSATAGLGPLIDTRGRGGFIVAPGSVFEGGSYLVENEAPVASLPAWILDELTKQRSVAEPAFMPARPRTPVTDRRRNAYGDTALNRSADAVATAPEGTRNDTLKRETFRMGRLVGGGVLQRDDVESELGRAAHYAGLPPGEASNTIASGLAAGTGHPRSIPDRDPLLRTRQQPKDTVMTKPGNEPETSDQTASMPSSVAEPDSTVEFEDVWSDLRASFDDVQLVMANWTGDNETDDVEPALEEASSLIARTAVERGLEGNVPVAADASGSAAVHEAANGESASFVEPVDAAYTAAEIAGIPTDAMEWTGISAIRDAVHNLWDTVKAVAARYWAELSADARVTGPLKSLAIRAARGIENLASLAADHLEQRAAQQQRGIESLANLRKAYINARGQVHAQAATHEWQRISALWGTVNTLARQTSDPGIRAVVARSADAISDHADALSRRATHTGQADAANVLTDLARAAENHASVLRVGPDHSLGAGPSPAPTAEVAGNKLAVVQDVDARALQMGAHEAARLAQAKRGGSLRSDEAVPRSLRGANIPRGQNDEILFRAPAAMRHPVRGPRW